MCSFVFGGVGVIVNLIDASWYMISSYPDPFICDLVPDTIRDHGVGLIRTWYETKLFQVM